MKEAFITIQGKQRQAQSETESFEFVTVGTYLYDTKKSVFSYMESEVTGLLGTKTSFEMIDETVHLVRKGTLQAEIILNRDKKHSFLYETPYGAYAMNVSTRYIHCELNAEGGTVEIDYTLDSNGMLISENHFYIQIKVQANKEKEDGK